MSARKGSHRRLIATTFVAGVGALLLGAITSRNATTEAAGDSEKESKAVTAHEVASLALSQSGQPASRRRQLPPQRLIEADAMASQALLQASVPSSRRNNEEPVSVNSSQPATLQSSLPRQSSAASVTQMRLPPIPGQANTTPVIPVAAHQLASIALMQTAAPSSRRQSMNPPAALPTSMPASQPLVVSRLPVPMLSSTRQGADPQLPRMAGASASDQPGRAASIPHSALRSSILQDGAANQGGAASTIQDDQLPPTGQGDTEDIPAPEGEDRTFGEEPEQDTRSTLQFLRTDTILLNPGEWQFDFTLQYAVDSVDFATAAILNNALAVGETVRRQRILLAPLEWRIGLSPDLQAFVNVPFGWSNSEVAFAGTEEFQNTGGIGDVSWGFTRRLVQGNEVCPDILGSVAWGAPTGEANLITAIASPGTNLGEGFWSMRGDLVFIHTYDPVVLFYGFGYRHRFNNSIDGVDINPGQHAYYRLGMGFAINPQVTVSTTFFGSYIGSDVINNVRVAGGIREPMSLRFAATVTPKECVHGFRTIEPFVNVGLTEEAIDTTFGVSWTR